MAKQTIRLLSPFFAETRQPALNDVSSVVLTETSAKKLFNSIDVIGKIVELDADPSFEKLGKPLVVSAVAKDPPRNSSLQFEVLFPFTFMQLSFQDEAWLNAYLGTFIALHPNADVKKITKKFNEDRMRFRLKVKC